MVWANSPNASSQSIEQRQVMQVDDAEQFADPRAPALRRVKSSDRTIDILEFLARSETPLTLTQIGEALGVPKSSLYQVLKTLETRGWIETDPLTGKHYRIGIRALLTGFRYVDIDPLVRRMDPVLTAITAELDETSHLGRLDGADIVYLDKRESSRRMRMLSAVGRRLPAHVTAMGKVIMAHRPWDEVEALLPRELVRMGPNTITSRHALRDELQAIRERGYSIDDEESAEMMRAVAVLVPPERGAATTNAVSVSASSLRLLAEDVGRVAGVIRDHLRQAF